MKNIILTLAGSMVFGLTSLLAQNTDKTQNSNSTTQQNTIQEYTQGQQQQDVYAQPPVQQQPQPQINRQQQPQLNQQQNNPAQSAPQPAVPQQRTYPDPKDQYQSPSQNQTMVQPNELPSTMQQTLQEQQYRGWENSSIYRDRTTGEYSLHLREGNETPKVYRFDRNGRVIDEANKPTQTIRGPEGVKDIDQ